MKWWNVIKNEMMDMGGATGSEIKPLKIWKKQGSITLTLRLLKMRN